MQNLAKDKIRVVARSSCHTGGKKCVNNTRKQANVTERVSETESRESRCVLMSMLTRRAMKLTERKKAKRNCGRANDFLSVLTVFALAGRVITDSPWGKTILKLNPQLFQVEQSSAKDGYKTHGDGVEDLKFLESGMEYGKSLIASGLTESLNVLPCTNIPPFLALESLASINHPFFARMLTYLRTFCRGTVGPQRQA